MPQSYILSGDPYQKQVEECVQLISKEVSRQLETLETHSKFSSEDLKKLAGMKFIASDRGSSYGLVSIPGFLLLSLQTMPCCSGEAGGVRGVRGASVRPWMP